MAKQLKRSVDLTVVAATLSRALLVDALRRKFFLMDKPPHHNKVMYTDIHCQVWKSFLVSL